MPLQKALLESKGISELVHNHLLACEYLIALNNFDAASDFQREEDRKEEVKANQEVPKEVMQLHYICCHEKCAVAQVSAPQDFCCSSCLVRIEVEPQCPPALIKNTRQKL